MNVKFVQAYHYVAQENFLGTNTFVKVPIGVVHISISDTVLCGQDKHKILSTKSDAKISETQSRPSSNMCPECIKLYKERKDSDWHKWVLSTGS